MSLWARTRVISDLNGNELTCESPSSFHLLTPSIIAAGPYFPGGSMKEISRLERLTLLVEI